MDDCTPRTTTKECAHHIARFEPPISPPLLSGVSGSLNASFRLLAATLPHYLACGATLRRRPVWSHKCALSDTASCVSRLIGSVHFAPLPGARGESRVSTQTLSPEVTILGPVPVKRASLPILQPEVTYTGAPTKPLHCGLPKAAELPCVPNARRLFPHVSSPTPVMSECRNHARTMGSCVTSFSATWNST